MENFLSHVKNIARYGHFKSMLRHDVPLPLVAIEDVARAISDEILSPRTIRNLVREIQGPENLSMSEAADLIAGVIGRPVKYFQLSANDPESKRALLAHAEGMKLWNHLVETNCAFNARRVRFYSLRTDFDNQSQTFGDFLHSIWLPTYEKALASVGPAGDELPGWVRLKDELRSP